MPDTQPFEAVSQRVDAEDGIKSFCERLYLGELRFVFAQKGMGDYAVSIF